MLNWCITTPAHRHTAPVAGAQRRSAKVKCKSEGALRQSAKVKWKSDVCREAAPIIPQISPKVKKYLRKKGKFLHFPSLSSLLRRAVSLSL